MTHHLPLGQTESFTYDAAGNMLSHTDFNGDTTAYAYSPCCGRLLLKTHADGSQVAYTYTGNGKRESLTDSRGVTTYAYDPRDRLIEEIHPDGTHLSYTYDAKGNRLTVTTDQATTSCTYDALSRLETVTAPEGTTTYTYDAVGNRDTVTSPNGAVTEYVYDDLNRSHRDHRLRLRCGRHPHCQARGRCAHRLSCGQEPALCPGARGI